LKLILLNVLVLFKKLFVAGAGAGAAAAFVLPQKPLVVLVAVSC
jgi:hypothetical protein